MYDAATAAAQSVDSDAKSIVLRRLEDAKEQRRHVRFDSLAELLELTALVPPSQWRTGDLRPLLYKSSDAVRHWCLLLHYC